MKLQFKLAQIISVYLFAATNGFAQTDNFKNGYIITNQCDTVFGQIDLRTNIINQSQCCFRTDEKAEYIIYKPFDIKSYYFIDDKVFYISKTIVIDDITLNTFIEFLVNGIMNLYYYEYKTDKYSHGGYYQYQGLVKYYFFEDETGKMYAVGKKPDEIVSYNYTKSDNSYKNITEYIFKDVPEVLQRIKNLQFNQKSFIKITEDYHNAVCTDGQQCIIYQNPNPDKRGYINQISLFVGYNFYNFAYIYEFTTTSGDHYRTNLNVDSSFPTLGVEIKMVNPRLTKFFGSQVELSVSQLKIAKTTGALKINLPHNDYYTIPVEIDANNAMYGKFKFGLIGIYPSNKFQPIGGCGVYFSKLFGNNHNKYFDLGGSLTLGVDYTLNAIHHLIFRINYDKSFVRANYDEVFVGTSKQLLYSDYVKSVFSANIGYSF